MGRLPNGVRDGLLELFYGVYDKDPDRCLEALIAMGVLVPTGDKMSVRRTAEFFLRSFGDRLDQEKAEREELEKQQAELGFKPQRTKDETKQRRKQVRGETGTKGKGGETDEERRRPCHFFAFLSLPRDASSHRPLPKTRHKAHPSTTLDARPNAHPPYPNQLPSK